MFFHLPRPKIERTDTHDHWTLRLPDRLLRFSFNRHYHVLTLEEKERRYFFVEERPNGRFGVSREYFSLAGKVRFSRDGQAGTIQTPVDEFRFVFTTTKIILRRDYLKVLTLAGPDDLPRLTRIEQAALLFCLVEVSRYFETNEVAGDEPARRRGQ